MAGAAALAPMPMPMPAWQVATMSTSAAQLAQAARAWFSASLSSPLLRGCIAGSVQRVTVAQALSVIVGAGEGGTGVQAHNIVRQGSIGPGANRLVLIDQFPQLLLIGREPRVDLAARALELRALRVLLAYLAGEPRNQCVARACSRRVYS